MLEINSNHPIFEKLCSLYAEDKDKLKEYTQLLYDQALLIEGVSIDDPVAFSNRDLQPDGIKPVPFIYKEEAISLWLSSQSDIASFV